MIPDQKAFLAEKARQIRCLTVEAIGAFGAGHIGGCLSIADVLSVLYFDKMNVDPNDPKKDDRDRLVVSKGHAGPAVYAALALKGFFPIDWLQTLNKPGTNLPSHCDMLRTPGVDMTAGSLGQGISCGVGMAKAAKLRGYGAHVYAIIGDGESQEGQVWEASMAAAHFGLDNLIVFLDKNGFQIDGAVEEVMDVRNSEEKWASFGFFTQSVDGHDVEAIAGAVDKAKAEKRRPSMIVLDTVKGKGVKFIEDAKAASHYMPISKEQMDAALDDLSKNRKKGGNCFG